ncbi:MAG: fructosamine kinase family protein [Chloroflexota bacterium]
MSNLNTIIALALQAANDKSSLRERATVGGGDISQAVHLRTDQSTYILKWSERGLPGFFDAEAHGLTLLASTGAVRVPEVIASQSDVAGQPDFLLLEWLAAPPSSSRRVAAEALGHALATLHQSTAAAYGLDCDNYIGATPQPNEWMTSWVTFFRERRLRFQTELAQRYGRLSGDRAHRMEQLLDRLDTWIDEQAVQPALLHGDLWGGNFIIGPGGAPALIDPAVSYGDREADLSFTTLFGGFPDAFYHAYEEAWPLAAGWQERRDLYNLYHLLNHLNLFGESYGSSVDTVLRRYT